MAAFALHFPTVAGSTDNWTPSRQPQLPLSEDDNTPALVTQLTDPLVVHTEVVGRYVRRFEYAFDYLTETDRTNLRAFVATVLGAGFEFVEPVTEASIPVKFASLQFPWRRSHRASLWAVSVALLEVE